MFDDFKESFINFITSRIFVLMLVVLLFYGILLGRVFLLQIIHGEDYAESFTMRIKKEINIASTRGKIYDRNGEILADNVLSYSITIEDNGTYQSDREKQASLNRIISRVIEIAESHGDSIISDFGIICENGRYVFTQEGTALLRFKADIYGRRTIEELEPKESAASAEQIMDYLCGKRRYYISWDAYTPEQREAYGISEEDLSLEEKLKIATVRYAMSLNGYKRYVATTIASDVCDETVAEIMENLDSLQGVDIAQSSLRVYNDAEYFASLIGYIGKPSQEELDSLLKEAEAKGVTGERNRLKELDAISASVAQEALNNAKYGEKPLDAKEFAYQAMLDDKIKMSAYMQNTVSDAEESGVNNVGILPEDSEVSNEADELAAYANKRKEV